MLFRLIVLLFLVYLAVRLFQRFDRFIAGRKQTGPPKSRRNVPPRRQERYADRIEDAHWEDVSDPSKPRR